METVSSPKAVFKVGSGSQRQAMVVVIAEENNKIVTNDLTIIMIMVEVGEGDFMLLASLQPIFENNGQMNDDMGALWSPLLIRLTVDRAYSVSMTCAVLSLAF